MLTLASGYDMPPEACGASCWIAARLRFGAAGRRGRSETLRGPQEAAGGVIPDRGERDLSRGAGRG